MPQRMTNKVAAFAVLPSASVLDTSFPPSQKGFSLSNIAAFMVASLKTQWSFVALFRHLFASEKALKCRNIGDQNLICCQGIGFRLITTEL